MSFSFKNYNVLYMPPDFFENNDPGAGDTIGTANLADIKTIGTLTSDSAYKIEPDQVGRSSTGVNVIYSRKLTIEMKIASDLTAAQLADLDGQIKSIVLAPKEIIIPEGAADLSDATVIIPTTSKVIVFKADTLEITEDVKLGTLQVIPITLKMEIVAPNGSPLKKEFGFTLA